MFLALRGRLLNWSVVLWGVWFVGGAGAFLFGRGLEWVWLEPFVARTAREGEGVVFLCECEFGDAGEECCW